MKLQPLLFFLFFVLVVIAIIGIDMKEGWYPSGTYVNTPGVTGVYPNTSSGRRYPGWHRRNYYNPYGFYRRFLPWTLPTIGGYSAVPYGVPVPYGNPVPVNTIRWGNRSPFGPMLTSLKSPKDYYIGQWVKAGSAYTDNPNDFTYYDVEQLNLDPGRDMFRYRVITKDGQTIPIYLDPHQNRLEDGDRFQIQGMEGKGDFVFNEADKYNFVYV